MKIVHSLHYACDFFVLWAFGRLALLGQNSYDQIALRSILDSLGIGFSSDPLSGHVPWIIWLYAIFSIFPFPISRVLWLAFSISSLTSYAWWSIRYNYLRSNLSEVQWCPIMIAIFSFSPLLYTVHFGQSNFLMCLGLMGFLYYRGKNDSRSAGLSLSFMLVKPHLFAPLFAFLATQAVYHRKFTLLGWCVFAVVFQLGLTGLLSPATVSAYPAEVYRAWSATQGAYMPSASLLIAHFTNIASLRPALLLFGVLAGVALGIRNKDTFNRSISILMPLGFLCAPFCWGHTFVVLLPQYLKLSSVLYSRNKRAYLLFATLFFSSQVWIWSDSSMSKDAYNVIIPLGIFWASIVMWRRKLDEDLSPELRGSALKLS
jgi:hypothetical protein